MRTASLAVTAICLLASFACGRTDGSAKSDLVVDVATHDALPSATFKWVELRSASGAAPEEYPARLLNTGDTGAVIVPPLPARILSLLAKPGDAIAKDGAIARVVMPDADTALAALRAASASLDVVTKRRAQLAPLESEGLVKASEVAALDLDIARYAGERVRAQAVLQSAGLNGGGIITLHSPVAGIVTEVAAIRGELRRPEDGPIARVRSRGGQRIEASIPSRPPEDANYIFRAASEPARPVTLVNVAPKSSGVGFLAWFDAAQGASVPIASEGRVAVLAKASPDARVVPAGAIGTRGDERFVVVRSRTSGTARLVVVEVVRIASSDAIVTGALSEAELVASDPYAALGDGGVGAP